jgi:uncharacterized OB-fold protein
MPSSDPPERVVLVEDAPFWAAVDRGALALATCARCSARSAIARSCPHCGSRDFAWTSAEARGEVRSFVTFHRPFHPYFADRVPYLVAVVALVDGPELIMGLDRPASGEPFVGMPVEIVMRTVGSDAIPTAVPVGGPDA